MKKLGMCSVVMLVLFTLSVCAQSQSKEAVQKEAPVKIRITIGDKMFIATMNNGSAAHDFLTLLPLTLTLEDYSKTEKISYLPRKLSIVNDPEGIDPEIGDLTYYAPWGNIALFYRDFGYSSGLVSLGKLDAGIESFTGSASVIATFEVIK